MVAFVTNAPFERHVSWLFTTPTLGNLSATSNSGTNESDSHVCENEGSLLTWGDRSCTKSPTTMLSVEVPKDRLIGYVLQETKLKLERGHSISDIEQHLRNAATLIGGDQIPITWSEVLNPLHPIAAKCAQNIYYPLHPTAAKCAHTEHTAEGDAPLRARSYNDLSYYLTINPVPRRPCRFIVGVFYREFPR